VGETCVNDWRRFLQKLQGEREELLRKLRELERKLADCKGEAEQWDGEAHELKKALSAAQTQAVTYANSLQVLPPAFMRPGPCLEGCTVLGCWGCCPHHYHGKKRSRLSLEVKFMIGWGRQEQGI